MKKVFGQYMIELAEKDKDVILIVGDIGFGIFDEFRKRFSDRFFNFGICEQATTGALAGMALSGLKPYYFTITPFLTERNFESLKVDIDLNKAKVCLVGHDDYPQLGPTHAMLDNGNYMKCFKNITSYFPKTKEEMISNLDSMYKSELPCFIRLKNL